MILTPPLKTVKTERPADLRPSSIRPELLFNSSFGGTTRLAPAAGPNFHGPADQYEDILGTDTSKPEPNVWENISSHPNLGDLRIYYEQGNVSQRWARIVSDESNPERKVLRFEIREPNVTIQWPHGLQHKSRVQAELYGNTDLHEFYQTVRLRLSNDLHELEQYPTRINWLTLFEFWNQPGWVGLDYPFRITVGLEKLEPYPGGKLRFGVHSQTMRPTQAYDNVWSTGAPAFEVPYATWMNLEIYYREGGKNEGRFYMAATPEGGKRQVLFDVRDVTHHPENAAPSGMTHFSPMKLYTSAELVDFLRARGKAMTVDWDEFSLWKGRTPPEGIR